MIGAEIPDGKRGQLGLLSRPDRCGDESLGEQVDVVSQPGVECVGWLLAFRQKIEQERRKRDIVQKFRHALIARAMPAAAATMGK